MASITEEATVTIPLKPDVALHDKSSVEKKSKKNRKRKAADTNQISTDVGGFTVISDLHSSQNRVVSYKKFLTVIPLLIGLSIECHQLSFMS